MRTTTVLLFIGLVPAVGFSAPQEQLVAIPEVAVPPVIDGRIDPTEWTGAAVTCGFRDAQAGLPARAPVVVSLGYDRRNLYCLFECKSPHEDLGKWVGHSSDRDAALGSAVDLMLSPEKWPVNRYAYFAVSSSGAFADSMCTEGKGDRSWNPEWKRVAASDTDRWFAEISIPWSILELEEPQAGTILRANLGRSVLSIGERSTWGGFADLEKGVGRIVLAGRSPAVALSGVLVSVPDSPHNRTGEVIVKARLIGEAPTARLEVRVAPEAEPRALTHSSRFSQDSEEGYWAVAELEVPVGSSGLEVSAHGPDDQLLWQHVIPLDVPDLVGHLRSMRSTLNQVGNWSAAGFPASDIPVLRQTLAELEENVRKPLDGAELVRVSRAVGEAAVRVKDLDMLARTQRHVRKQGPRQELPSYYVTNPASTRKIQPTSPDPGPLVQLLRVAMARGEYEPVQVVVCAVGQDLKGVQASVTALQGPRGAVIPKDRAVVTPLGFVRIGVPSKDAPLIGMVPDVLFPNRAMEVPAGHRQPFFITIQTTARDAAGEYRGAVRVTAENSAPVQLPLVVRVYGVTLPVKSHLRTVFVLWGHFMGPYLDNYQMTFRDWIEKRRAYLENLGPNERSAYLETYIRCSKALLAYRVSPTILYPVTLWSPQRKADGSWDFAAIDQVLSALAPLGLTTFNLGGPPIYDIYVGGTGEVQPEQVAFVKAAAAHLKERGWWNLHYVYGYDEASRGFLDKLRANYRALVEAVPDLKIMQTAWSPDSALKGLVKIWCPLTPYADMDAIRAGQKAGEECWWYVCCSPTKPFANVFIDYPGIDQRLLGWMTYRYGIQGFLYWGVDWWMWNSPPLSQYVRDDYARWGTTYPGGDGSLLYPAGEGELPLPSLRLALLRDGFEDYDLFTEVCALAARGGRGAARARQLLSLDAPILRSLTDYTQDDDLLFARREAILRVGEELGRVPMVR